jgi:hypothetical protein
MMVLIIVSQAMRQSRALKWLAMANQSPSHASFTTRLNAEQIEDLKAVRERHFLAV